MTQIELKQKLSTTQRQEYLLGYPVNIKINKQVL